jgi:hypothetical protein
VTPENKSKKGLQKSGISPKSPADYGTDPNCLDSKAAFCKDIAHSKEQFKHASRVLAFAISAAQG